MLALARVNVRARYVQSNFSA